VTPPEHVRPLVEARQARKPILPSCCSHKPAEHSCCTTAPRKKTCCEESQAECGSTQSNCASCERETPSCCQKAPQRKTSDSQIRWVIGVFAKKCRGVGPDGIPTFEPINRDFLPTILFWLPGFVEELPLSNQFPHRRFAPPPVPPPRAIHS
jgi:hypothetical protein